MSPDPLIGSLAAIGAALCWVFTALSFAAAGRRVGSAVVNTTRLVIAVVILILVHRFLFGTWWPEASATSVAWLAASGIIGLGIGDQLLFQALIDVGSRIPTLLLTLAPPVAAILAWPVLDETLSIVAILGMAITLGGIAWVVSDRQGDKQHPHPRRGVLFGAGAGIAQAVGLILAKLGMGIEGTNLVDPWPATLLRMVFGTAMAFVLLIAIRLCRSAQREVNTGQGRLTTTAGFILIGAILGPVLGVWLSLVGIENVEIGIASTLMSLSPVFILPFAAWVERDRVTWRGVMGAIISVVGVMILAFSLGRGGVDASAEPDALSQGSDRSLSRVSTSG